MLVDIPTLHYQMYCTLRKTLIYKILKHNVCLEMKKGGKVILFSHERKHFSSGEITNITIKFVLSSKLISVKYEQNINFEK